jgi:hypothetical protein
VNELELVLESLADSLPTGAGDGSTGLAVHVTEVELVLPVESRIVRSGLELSLPRGRLATGFAPLHGRLRACFVRGTP